MYYLFLFILSIVAVYLMYYGIKHFVALNTEPTKLPEATDGITPNDDVNQSYNSMLNISVDVVPDVKPKRKHSRLHYFCVKDNGYNIQVWPKDQYVPYIIEFNIAGITYGEHISEHLGEFVATLESEPSNPHDPNAIKIVTNEGHRVGYVPRDMTARIRDSISLPCSCYCYIGKNNNIYFSDCYIILS